MTTRTSWSGSLGCCRRGWLHGPIESTPAGQAAWGLSYIQGAYGDPINAYRQWSARSPHWYDTGGELPPGATTVMNGLGHSETVLPLPPKLIDNLLARGGDGAQITLHASQAATGANSPTRTGCATTHSPPTPVPAARTASSQTSSCATAAAPGSRTASGPRRTPG